MEIKELLKMQEELEQYIIDNIFNLNVISDKTPRVYGSSKEFLTVRLLAAIVELSELANATRCFKYWSKKPSEPQERLLDEYADVFHFLLSIGNTMGFTAEEIEQAYIKKHEENYKRQESGY